MALKACRECGNQVSDKADSCPQCGAKVKKTSLITKIVLGFVIVSILMVVIGALLGGKESQTVNNEQVSSNSATEGPVPPEEKQPNWVYQTIKDELHNKDSKFALSESTNKAYFGSPYDGGSSLILTVRKNHAGTDVYITITKGQFVCRLTSGCDVAFKFDNGEIMQITMVEPDSYASDVLFVALDSTEEKIINKLKTSKKLIIAPNFYQHGVEQFTFDVSDYKAI